jgi:hypothetical protein
MSITVAVSVAPFPAPTTLEQTGLAPDQIEMLMVKTLYGGEATGLTVADRMRLPFQVIEPLLDRARAERLIEVRGMAGSGTASYRFALTDLGRDRAQQYLAHSHYCGPAPVSLAAYMDYMRQLAEARGFLDRERLRAAFAHLVVGDEMLQQLGPAVNAGKAVFLYGPPGNGKTMLAEGMGHAIGGEMYVPHAIDVDGHIITMFDPTCHQPLEEMTDRSSLVALVLDDRRWVRIRRPVVVAGGELTLDQLDLRYNQLSRFYEAPMQLKANGGVFLVDDFGRQRMRPEDLLNRWIVPLESRVDYLTLHTGKKFQVPFDVLTMFATNLDPASLADEAFLRRIPYKIAVGNPTVDQFTQIFEMNCRARRMRFHRVMVAYLYRRHYLPPGRALRACHPRDLLDQIIALCRYRGIEPAVTRELLDAACTSYFVDEGLPRSESRGVPRPESTGGPQAKSRGQVH